MRFRMILWASIMPVLASGCSDPADPVEGELNTQIRRDQGRTNNPLQDARPVNNGGRDLGIPSQDLGMMGGPDSSMNPENEMGVPEPGDARVITQDAGQMARLDAAQMPPDAAQRPPDAGGAQGMCGEACTSMCSATAEACGTSCYDTCAESCDNVYMQCLGGCAGIPPCQAACSNTKEACVDECALRSSPCHGRCTANEEDCRSACGCD